jgi:hypothetical protein
MKYYIANELSCLYRLNMGVLEYAPMISSNVIDTEDFAPVEPELVGEEQVTFSGVETNLYGVYSTVTKALCDHANFDEYFGKCCDCDTTDEDLHKAHCGSTFEIEDLDGAKLCSSCGLVLEFAA